MSDDAGVFTELFKAFDRLEETVIDLINNAAEHVEKQLGIIHNKLDDELRYWKWITNERKPPATKEPQAPDA